MKHVKKQKFSRQKIEKKNWCYELNFNKIKSKKSNNIKLFVSLT